MNVYGKLAKCRVELQEAKLKKSGKNKFAGFDYFELADFLPTANKIFNDNGLCPIFNIFGDKAVLNIFNSEKPDEVITFQSTIAKLELKGCNEIQALGGTITYMRRYLYINALEIVENDSFDAVTGQQPDKKEKVVKIADKTAPVLELKSENECPICHKPTSAGALKAWGMCAECKKAGAKNEVQK